MTFMKLLFLSLCMCTYTSSWKFSLIGKHKFIQL